MQESDDCSAPPKLAPSRSVDYIECDARQSVLWPVHRSRRRNAAMAWTTPTLVEICIGLEINGYLPAEI
jgi:coenzyme PQQ precursor peptide PqqA